MELDRRLIPERAFRVAQGELGEAAVLSREFTRAGTPRWRRLLAAGWTLYGVSFFLPMVGDDAIFPGTTLVSTADLIWHSINQDPGCRWTRPVHPPQCANVPDALELPPRSPEGGAMAPPDPRDNGRGRYLHRDWAHRGSLGHGNVSRRRLLDLRGLAHLCSGGNVDAGSQVGVANRAPGHNQGTAGVTSALAAPTTHTTSSRITRANLPPRS